MRRMFMMLVAGFAILTLAAPAEAAKKQPVVKASGACKPSDSGMVYRNYNHCLTLNQRNGGGARTGTYCSRFCSQ